MLSYIDLSDFCQHCTLKKYMFYYLFIYLFGSLQKKTSLS